MPTPSEQMQGLLGDVPDIGIATGQQTGAPSQQMKGLMDGVLDPMPAVKAAIGKNPDEEAKHQALSTQTGLPIDAVKADPEAVEQMTQEQFIAERLKKSPITSEKMSDPEFAAVASDAVEPMGDFETLAKAFNRGGATVEAARLGFQAMKANDPAISAALLAQRKAIIEKMGESEAAGVLGFFESAAEVVGQQAKTLFSPKLPAMVAGGALIGGTLGLAGGPLAPATVTAGTVAGMVAGATSFFATEVFQQEAGSSFAEQIDMGIDPETAKLTATAVGFVNAALETGSAAVILKPASDLVKGMIRKGIKEAMIRPTVMAAAKTAVQSYGIAVATEVSTEVAQEVVAIAAEEVSKAFSEKDLEGLTYDEIVDRLEGVASKTFKAMVVLGPIAPGSRFISESRRAVKQSKDDRATLDALNKKLKGSPLLERAPDKAIDHATAVLDANNIGDIFIRAEAVAAFAAAAGTDPASIYKQLGVDDQIDEALMLGGDVKLSTEAFTRHVLASDDYDLLADHVRRGVDGMTTAEAEAFTQEGTKDELERLTVEEVSRDPTAEADLTSDSVQTREGALDILTNDEERQAQPGRQKAGSDEILLDAGFTPAEVVAMSPEDKETLTAGENVVVDGKKISPKTVSAVAVAADQLGLQGLFRSAEEAGLAPAQYESYLVAVQRAADAAKLRQEQKLIKQRLREISQSWKAELATAADEARQTLSQEPVYAAVQGIGRDRLDRAQVVAALPDGQKQLGKLPRQERDRNIFTDQNETGGIDLDTYAQLHDFPDGQVMLFSMMDAKPFEEAVAEHAERATRSRHPNLLEERQNLEAAIESLHNDKQAEILAFEMNQMRAARGQGALRPALLRKLAKENLQSHKIKDITAKKFVAAHQRLGRLAGKLLRNGDRGAAMVAKFQQLLNFQYAQEAYATAAKVEKQRKYLLKFFRARSKWTALPGDYLDSIRALLHDYQLDAKLSNKKRKDLEAWVAAKQAAGETVDPPKRLIDASTKKHYTEMTLAEWQELYDTVREMHHIGVSERKMLLETEKRERDVIAGEVAALATENLTGRGRVIETRTLWEKTKRFGREALTTLLNADTLLREIDGGQDLGPAYSAIKGGIDRAMTEGYQPGQIGYARQKQKQARALLKLYSVFPKSERGKMHKRIAIPGLNARLTRAGLISVLLNSGNADGIAAMTTDSGQLTIDELQAIHQAATKEDWEFAQSVWDYLGSFWPDIEQAMTRRRGFAPERVLAQPIDTPFGQYRGGYYPLRYDGDQSILPGEKNVEEMIREARFGKFSASHTARGHTEERVGSGGRKVLLDPFVLHSHVDQVIYDLEVGDAVTDAYRILHNRELKKSFENVGHLEKWMSLDLWLGDVTTGEMRLGGVLEHSLRWIRTGYTVSKLAWNVGTILLQPLGLLQTSVVIGNKSLLYGLQKTLFSKPVGAGNIYEFVASQTGFMAQREENFNKDIVDASHQLAQSFLARHTPGKSAEVFTASFFYGIKKMQRLVDTVTWLGAQHKGMQQFDGDRDKANTYADRMVARSQASGNFQERTQFERGSSGAKTRQTETVRVFTALISYFMAKTNIAYERTRQTNFRDPAQAISWAVDMALLYVVEGILAALIRGQWPDEDDEEGGGWGELVLDQSVNAVFAGVPIIREFISEAQGFRGGGAFSSTVDQFGRFVEQIGQGEFDQALRRNGVNMAGILFKLPASQVNKTLDAIDKADEGEEVSLSDFLFGPAFDK